MPIIPIMENLTGKKEKIIIRISTEEAKYLLSKGVKMGENGISHTSGHRRSYYLTESKRNLQMLEKFRNAKVIRTKRKQ